MDNPWFMDIPIQSTPHYISAGRCHRLIYLMRRLLTRNNSCSKNDNEQGFYSHLIMINLILCITVHISLIGCATTPSQSGAKILDADANTAPNCLFLGDVDGSSGWGNRAASIGIENAKNEAREKAAAMGATHIFWNSMVRGFKSYVSGNAYKCK